MKRPTSLRGRLLRQFLFVGVAPVLVAAAAAVLLIAPVLEDQAQARNRDLATSLRDQVQLQLILRQRTASVLAAQLHDGVLAGNRTSLALQAMVDGDPYVQAAFLADRRGLVTHAALATNSGRFVDDLIGADLSRQPHYQRARAGKTPIWSDSIFSTLTGQITAVLTVPIEELSLVVELSLAGLSESVADLARGSTAEIIVLDRRGRVVAHPDPGVAQRQESMASQPIVQRARDGIVGGAREAFDGVEYLTHTLNVESVGWTVLAKQRASVVMAPIRQIGSVLALLAALAGLGALGISWLYSRRTGNEVTRLAEAAQAVAQDGSPRSTLQQFTTAEFNDVWTRLRELFKQLHDRDQQTQSARQDLQAVLDAATEVAIISTDTEGLVTIFNVGAQRMLGMSGVDVVGRLTPMAWHDPAEVDARAAELSRKYGMPVSGFEAFVIEARHGGYEVRDWTLIHGDGSRIDVSLAVTSVRTPEGDLKGFLGVAVDITQRRRAAALELSQQRAELANQAKSEFLSRVSHELRTPLNAMLGYAQLIEIDRQEPPTTTQRNRVQHIQRAGWHLVQLIDDVLDLSRIESGQLKVQLEAVDVEAVIQRATSLVATHFDRAQVTFEVRRDEPPRSQPLFVHADPTRLVQALVNLLSNAAKYSRPGGHVFLDCIVGSDTLSIAVRDSGIGMSAHQLERMFRPFDRLGLEQGEIAGTGIGLVITKHLIEMMNGSLSVTSQPDVGSTFAVRLRLAPHTPAEQLQAAAFEPSRSGSSQRSVGRYAVLYIEDNEVNAQLMRAVLRQRPQFSLQIATTLASGLAMARAHLPDVILLDMHLPDGSGHDMLDAMASDPALRDTPVIVVSADATRKQMVDLADRVHAYVTKPINIVEVLRTIDSAIAGRPTRT